MTEQYSDGRVKSTEYSKGKKQGLCIEEYPDGTFITTHFENDLEHGECKAEYADGTVVISNFYQGKPHGKCQEWSAEKYVETDFHDGKQKGPSVAKLNDYSTIEIEFV